MRDAMSKMIADGIRSYRSIYCVQERISCAMRYLK